MKDLVTMNLTMSSLEIAKLTGKRHKNVLRDIETMLLEIGSDLSQSFYPDRYKRQQVKYNLNKELTFTLITGYSIKLRNRIVQRWLELEANKLTPELDARLWAIARQEGKLARAEVTDTIKDFITYAEAQGSKNARFYYANITKGTYKALFILEQGGGWKQAREYLTTFQLNQLATAEYLAQKTIAKYMDAGTHYKDIYKLAIDEVEKLATLLGKSAVTYCNQPRLEEVK